MTLSPEDLAWAAGMFEGEGSVRINKPTKRNLGALLADMVNVQPEVTKFYADHWGGYHRAVSVPAPRRSYWRWRIASTQAAGFLAAIQPHLRTGIYRERVALALEFQGQKIRIHNGPDGCRTPEYAARQVAYYERMRELNVRGC